MLTTSNRLYFEILQRRDKKNHEHCFGGWLSSAPFSGVYIYIYVYIYICMQHTNKLHITYNMHTYLYTYIYKRRQTHTHTPTHICIQTFHTTADFITYAYHIHNDQCHAYSILQSHTSTIMYTPYTVDCRYIFIEDTWIYMYTCHKDKTVLCIRFHYIPLSKQINLHI